MGSDREKKTASTFAALVRLVFRWLPVGHAARQALKGMAFRVFAPVFRRTDSYRHWALARRDAGLISHRSRRGGGAETLPDDFDAIFAPWSSRGEVFEDIRLAPLGDTGLKVIAFYLPQFHPFPENDEWWGRGFTEWTNVTKAVPQLAGHIQPRLPGELGFYDLRLRSVQERQIELARLYGIHGFCYHHYWFAGKRLMDAPFNQVLADATLDLPFCLCWANENWTRRWDGAEHDVLIAQNHTPEDDIAFIADIAPALRDSRYIRVDGAALLIVYRVALLPDARATAERWRRYCRENGIGELHLVAAQTFGIEDPREYGFDAAVQFPPHNIPLDDVSLDCRIFNPSFRGRVYRYSDIVERAIDTLPAPYAHYSCAFPDWDNTARKGGSGYIFQGATPDRFASWLRSNFDYTRATFKADARLTFVNAWNEWGEGAYLEPDRHNGYAYLGALGRVLEEARAPESPGAPGRSPA